MNTIEDDFIEDLLMTTTHHFIFFFTNKGRVYRMKAYEIPESARTARGTAIVNLLQLMPDERISAIIPIKEYDDEKYLFMATRKGIVKKTPLKEYANIRKTGLAAITLREDDELIEVKVTDQTKNILLVTKLGQCIMFNENDVRETGRTSMGVIGMSLREGDEVVGMQLDSQGESLLVVSQKGIGKRTRMDKFSVQRRGGKGVRCYHITDKTGELVGSKAVNPEDEIMLITTEGIVIRMSVSGISEQGRDTSGVKLMDIDPNSDVMVAGIAKVRDSHAKEQEEENIEEE